jgi:glutathione S-transferase
MRDEPLLYDVTDSPFCAKARICLQLKGVPYRRVPLTTRTRRDLKALNPLGKVPVLIDHGRPIADSTAIARYLEDEHPEPPLLPDDPAAAAYCRVLEDWADESLYFAVGAFKWLNPANRTKALARTMSEIDAGPLAPLVSRLIVRQLVGRYRAWRYGPESLAHFEDRVRDALGWLAELVTGRAFLLGRALTLADVAVYVQLAWMRGYAEARLLDEQPSVRAWMARLDAMPAVADGGFGAD